MIYCLSKVLREYWCLGSGRFLIWHAKNSGQRQNYLGLEIREKVLVILMFQLVCFWNVRHIIECCSLVVFCFLCLCSWWKEHNFGWMNWGLGTCKFPNFLTSELSIFSFFQRNNISLHLELFSFHSYFMFANATVSFEKIISSYPGPLSLVSILVSVARCSIRIHLAVSVSWVIDMLVQCFIISQCYGSEIWNVYLLVFAVPWSTL